MAKTKLNIYLGKSGWDIQDFIRNLNPEPNCVDLPNGKFYYKQVEENKPKWLDSFFGDIIDDDPLRNKTIQAAYLTSVKVNDNESRVFAITFGLGRNLLKLECFEERFGIITAMNLIDSKCLRSIDSNTLDSNPKSSRVQLGKTSSIKEFDLDNEYDILKSINGRLVEDRFEDAKTVNGRQSLSISISSMVNEIGESLAALYQIYLSDDYRHKFPGVDHTREIKDRAEIAQLDQRLLSVINGEPQPDIMVALSIPEIIPDKDIQGFGYGRSHRLNDDVNLEEMIEEIGNIYGGIDISLLKREHVFAQGENGERIGYWKIYQCIIAECRMNNHQYVLNDGKWYVYDDDYANEVNRYYQAAELSGIDFPDCSLTTSEGTYNQIVYNQLPNTVLWDCRLLNPFKDTPFEVCDIYDKDTDSFIHIKKKTGSAALSHLFLQGSVSGDMMNAKIVRQELLNRKPDMLGSIDENNFSASNYRVVYGIIEKGNEDDDRPNIPFFSRVSFRQVSRTLQNFGYTVQLKSIKWR